MHEDTTIPFMNPAFRDELSGCARAHKKSFDRPWKRSWGPFWRSIRPSVTRVPVFSFGTVDTVFQGVEAGGGGIAVAVPEGNIDERLRCDAHTLPRHLGGEVPESRRIPGEGSGGTARLLRLPCGVRGTSADDEPHRVDLRYHPFANGADQELPEREDGAELRASARHERREAVAPATRLPSYGRRNRRPKVRRWSGRKRNGQEIRWIQDGHTQDLTVTQRMVWLF